MVISSTNDSLYYHFNCLYKIMKNLKKSRCQQSPSQQTMVSSCEAGTVENVVTKLSEQEVE